MKNLVFIFTLFPFLIFTAPTFTWEKLATRPPVGGSDDTLGVAGAFSGIHNDVLIVAGGANFPIPFWENDKSWHKNIQILSLKDGNHEWFDGGALPYPTAYGASLSTPDGVICIGGRNETRVFDTVYRLSFDTASGRITTTFLPNLPKPCAHGAAALLNNIIYVAGGCSTTTLSSGMNNFWTLDLSREGTEGFGWVELLAWPGASRAFNLLTAQHNGSAECLYLMSGRCADATGAIKFLTDVYEFNPQKYKNGRSAWKRLSDAPRCMMAGTAAAIGQSHVGVLGGASGELFHIADSLKEKHPGFPQEALLYHTITDTWTSAGHIPENLVTTTAIHWYENIIIPGGELKPRQRSPFIWRVSLSNASSNFGALNFIVLILYLTSLLIIGILYSKNNSTDDFFRGGQQVPWWAAGLSIFATILSSVTFIAIPAKAYMTDWLLVFINLAIFAVAPFVIRFIMPFYRRLDVTSAYEYLEKRFNLFVRLFASLSFILFQIGRMAIVMYLPALALALVTSLPVTICIILMGGLSLIYCTLGGVRAVIWTDALQAVVLLSGAFISLVLILAKIDGLSTFFTTAVEFNKFKMVHWDWSWNSMTTGAIWVVVFGGMAQQFVTYTSDQAVVQRYMAVSDESRAARATWMNAIVSLPATILFFGLGTGLFVFYRFYPAKLDPSFPNDAIFPLFIAHELPIGLAGLVVAGIFAAAQSTVSTSMNSTATVFVTDFIRRFSILKIEKHYLVLARFLTLIFGILGTSLALLFATSDIKSMWDIFMTILGLFGGILCGLFVLGMFTRRANCLGAVAGIFFGAAGLYMIQQKTAISHLLYAALGILLCLIFGTICSYLGPPPADVHGLTIHSLMRKK